jgi:two-component system response regulator AtoC
MPAEPDDPSRESTRSLAWSPVADGGARVLVFWDGGFATRSLAHGRSLVVGRSQDCDVHVINPTVSRRHVALHAGQPIMVEDLGSANGTRVWGRALRPHEPEPVEPGSVIEAGSTMIVVRGPADNDVSDAALTPAPSASGAATPMQRLERLSDLVAASELSVVLAGETGVGKEVLAERIHRRSPRASGPFVRLNCAALPETLLESELFGHERGAFTGAVKSKPGLLEVANGGSVFLDEVAELPPATQAKLLRVLESREVLRVGGLAPRPIDVRFIAASNRDLSGLVAQGAFRSDLYFRLDGITLQIPPLRERTDAIEALAASFIAFASQRAQRTPPVLSRDALRALERYPWPGNVRELRNTVERAMVLCGGNEIEVEHLFLDTARGHDEAPDRGLSSADEDQDLRHGVEQYERRRVVQALEKTGGNQTRAAELLGMSRRALVVRLTAYGLTRRRKP